MLSLLSQPSLGGLGGVTSSGGSSPSSSAKSGDINSAGSSFSFGDFTQGGFSNKTILIIGGVVLLGLLVWKRA